MCVRRTHLRFRITFAAEDAYRDGRRPRHVRSSNHSLSLFLSPVPSPGLFPSLSTRTYYRAHTVFIVYNDFRTFRPTPNVCLRTVCPAERTYTRPIVSVFERPSWLNVCIQRNSRNAGFTALKRRPMVELISSTVKTMLRVETIGVVRNNNKKIVLYTFSVTVGRDCRLGLQEGRV